jgi:hypothetical protein
MGGGSSPALLFDHCFSTLGFDHERSPAMNRPADPRAVVPKDEARQGVTGHNVRYVWGISLTMAIVAFVLLYVFYFAV